MLVLKKKKKKEEEKIYNLHASIVILCNTFSAYSNNHYYSGPNLMLMWTISSANKSIKRRQQH